MNRYDDDDGYTNGKTSLGGPIAAILAVILLVACVFCWCNMDNHSVDGGYVAYVYSEPLMGKKEYKGIINGPGGTGWVWRQAKVDISVTPWTMAETFTDIQAKDNLIMKAHASLVFRVNRALVKEFVEEYGAMAEVSKKPEAIIKDAYESFIQQHFRSIVRSEVSRYNALEASSSIPKITENVTTALKARLANTPFVVESVTIGYTIPPDSVIEGITKKVATTQTYERQAIERDIALRSEEIKEAEGRADAKKSEQMAMGGRKAAEQKADAEKYRAIAAAQASAESARLEADAAKYKAIAAAQAKAESVRLESEAEAVAIERVGKAKADAIRLQAEAINRNYIDLQMTESIKDIKWPSTYVGGGVVQDLLRQVIGSHN